MKRTFDTPPVQKKPAIADKIAVPAIADKDPAPVLKRPAGQAEAPVLKRPAGKGSPAAAAPVKLKPDPVSASALQDQNTGANNAVKTALNMVRAKELALADYEAKISAKKADGNSREGKLLGLYSDEISKQKNDLSSAAEKLTHFIVNCQDISHMDAKISHLKDLANTIGEIDNTVGELKHMFPAPKAAAKKKALDGPEEDLSR